MTYYFGRRVAARLGLFILLFVSVAASTAAIASMAVQESSRLRRQHDVLAAIAPARDVLGIATYVKESPPPPGVSGIVEPARQPTPQNTHAMAPAIYRIATSQPVIFITIDDGVTPNEAALQLMRQRGAVASLFLNDANIHRHYSYFKQWEAAGSTIQNHTVDHPDMTRLNAAAQTREICDDSVRLHAGTNASPTLFRPPYGMYNSVTRQAAAACGMKALVWWSAVVSNGQVQYQYPASSLQPGDIVLLHFLPGLDKDLHALFAQTDAQHLRIGRLEDWLY